MLSLTNSPTTEMAWHGKVYKVNLAFDHVLLFLEMQEDTSLDEFQKFQQTFKLFFGENESLPNDPDFYEKAMEQISKEITDSPYGTTVKNDDGGVENTKQFDYKRDAGAIYASFFDQYGIDLNKERGKMHWSIFKALFDGLGPKTYFQRILSIRQEDASKIKDPTAKNELVQAQNYYAVDGAKTEEQLEQESLNSDSLSRLFDSLLEQAKKGGN